ncbi:Cytochrome b561/ferric reductase transmembrane domain-containing protein [Dioscorea alata]|uniref:Cytochrome b561/ferric reductase transmembrane domain-containing protein n=1 Tax=Dioscorea alata TaxID=55571 RepID=A0ACB7W0R1_DIOAL|nr:Cytochrome b561/ferric reductase transmembrane domain-containing protein [Dioscorea alata]
MSLVSVNHLIPFNTTFMNCLTVWNSESFILRYTKSEQNLWNFILSAPNSGSYIALGFSNNGAMVKSSALVGWVNNDDGIGVIKQYYLGGASSRQCVPDQGNLQVMHGKSLIVSHSYSSYLYLAFQLNITQLPQYLIFAVGPKDTLPASDNFLPVHRNKLSIFINYDTGMIFGVGKGFGVVRRHGLMVMIGWGVLMPIGVMVARYFKKKNELGHGHMIHIPTNWFNTHMCIQALGFGLGLGGIIAGFGLTKANDESVRSHKSLAISILVFGSLQMMALVVRPEKSSKMRRYWNWYHWYVGRAAIACAIGNIFLGLSLAHEAKSYTIAYVVFLAVLTLISLLMEIRMWINNNNNNNNNI